MLLLAALLASAPATADETPKVERQARAIVRILKATTVRLGEGLLHGQDQPQIRETSLPDSDGQERPLILLEFS